ncbi:MAG: nucleoside triphosphate pyrophosphohydrolase [Alphaproteobacteria bacterium]|nr:nucleoside triphosphate pyrophosphohydrolase [Alphaproteobacteria bacterium]
MSEIARLLEIMRRLRDPEGGCPWDLEQDFASIAPYTIEEAYEVAGAIDAKDMTALREELGDLLLQVVYHAQMAAEAGHFGFAEVAAGIGEKMTRRHPHVFGDATVGDATAQTQAWEVHKAAERREKGKSGEGTSVLEGVTRALPALLRAEKLQKRAARVGFDWPNRDGVFAKVAEETAELKAELTKETPRLKEEMGDLLFACVNLARHLGVDAETALRAANAKFERRFRRMETLLKAANETLEGASLERLEALWQRAKAEEKPG